MKNWKYKHDLLNLSEALGKYLTGYLEYTPQEAVRASKDKDLYAYCSRCEKDTPILIPSKEKKELMNNGLKQAFIGAPSNLSPLTKHFWFHARCSQCGEDVSLMRS